jgi:hypothetical protein
MSSSDRQTESRRTLKERESYLDGKIKESDGQRPYWLAERAALRYSIELFDVVSEICRNPFSPAFILDRLYAVRDKRPKEPTYADVEELRDGIKLSIGIVLLKYEEDTAKIKESKDFIMQSVDEMLERHFTEDKTI